MVSNEFSSFKNTIEKQNTLVCQFRFSITPKGFFERILFWQQKRFDFCGTVAIMCIAFGHCYEYACSR